MLATILKAHQLVKASAALAPELTTLRHTLHHGRKTVVGHASVSFGQAGLQVVTDAFHDVEPDQINQPEKTGGRQSDRLAKQCIRLFYADALTQKG